MRLSRPETNACLGPAECLSTVLVFFYIKNTKKHLSCPTQYWNVRKRANVNWYPWFRFGQLVLFCIRCYTRMYEKSVTKTWTIFVWYVIRCVVSTFRHNGGASTKRALLGTAAFSRDRRSTENLRSMHPLFFMDRRDAFNGSRKKQSFAFSRFDGWKIDTEILLNRNIMRTSPRTALKSNVFVWIICRNFVYLSFNLFTYESVYRYQMARHHFLTSLNWPHFIDLKLLALALRSEVQLWTNARIADLKKVFFLIGVYHANWW